MVGKDYSKILRKVVSYSSIEQLRERISHIFNEEAREILISRKEDYYRTYLHQEQLRFALEKLPLEHEIIREIYSQTKKNLDEICTKSADQLAEHNPRYLTSFRLWDWTYPEHPGEIYSSLKKAAHHVINQRVLTKDIPPKEHIIMDCATRGMLGFEKSDLDETIEFLELLEKQKLVIPLAINGYISINGSKAVSNFNKFFNLAGKKEDFVLDGIKRGVDFEYIRERLKTEFPEYAEKLIQ